MDIKNKIYKIMNELEISQEGEVREKFSDYFESSVKYIAFIVELEQEFDIMIPDDYLLANNFDTIEDIEKLVEKCIQEN